MVQVLRNDEAGLSGEARDADPQHGARDVFAAAAVTWPIAPPCARLGVPVVVVMSRAQHRFCRSASSQF
jgi:hypothetical protein